MKSGKIINILVRFTLLTSIISFSANGLFGASLLTPSLESAGETNQSTKELINRKDIDAKYTWNLKDLYESDEAWEQDLTKEDALITKYKEFEGKLGASADELLKFLKLDEEVGMRLNKLYQYASQAKDLDLSNTKYQGMFDRIQNVGNKVSTSVSFVRPELLSIPEEKLWSFINGKNELIHYKHYIENILRVKPHTLSKDQEKLLSLGEPVAQTFFNTYSLFSNADIDFPTIKDSEGNDFKLSHARYYTAMYSSDRAFRERAYHAIYIPFIKNINFLSSNYSGSIRAKIFNAKARNYESTLAAALDENNIPLQVYHNLVNTVNENLKPQQRLLSIKKRVLKLNDFHSYDVYVTLFPAVKKKYTPEQGMELVLNALKPLGGDYIKNLKFAFDNRWIDFYETKGKRSGAYSTGGAKGIHPYVLLNWSGELNDVFTLAHEMGHNMHSWYSSNTQPYIYADYPTFLAEVASITNEALLLKYLIEHAESKEEKLALIEKGIDNIRGTFYRQTRFAEFEMKAQAMLEAGEAMTPDKYANLFGEIFQKYWGPEMITDNEEKHSWTRIHHFYYNFYVFQYATSLAASEALIAKIISEGQPAIDRYLNFLKSGSTDYAIPTLKKAGVDMTTAEPILAVTKKMNSLLDEMEKLIGQ